jgi:hypothetical protein
MATMAETTTMIPAIGNSMVSNSESELEDQSALVGVIESLRAKALLVTANQW